MGKQFVMTALDVLLLSDGRPGHYHLAEGILAAANRQRPLRVAKIDVRRPRWLTPGLLWRLSTSGLSPSVVLGYAYGLDVTTLPKAGLIVSAGGDTLAANVAAARHLGAANIFYGSLRRYAPECFSLVLTSYARRASKPRHVMTLKPNRLDPDLLPPLPPPAPSRLPALLGLLIGGDDGTIRYSNEDWTALTDSIEVVTRTHGARWIVSNSPRTPHAVSERLLRLAKHPGSAIAEFIDVRTSGTGSLKAMFERSGAILCTADSSSMLSEAVWARRPVVTVSPAAMMLPADEMGYRQYLETNAWARSLPISGLTGDHLLSALSLIKPLVGNPLDLLGATLAERLPQLFDPRPRA